MSMTIYEFIEYLSQQSFQSLEEKHGVETGFSKDRILCSLNYSQISSSSTDEVANYCRGMIVSRKDNRPFPDDLTQVIGDFQIVMFGFKRFFNMGDPAQAEIDWDSAEFQDKPDGTFIELYYHNRKWNVATRSVPRADVPIDDTGLTFAQLFINTIGGLDKYKFYQSTNYMFELETPYNSVTVQQTTSKVTLLGTRYVYPGPCSYQESTSEFVDKEAERLGFNRPKKYKFSSPEEMVEFVSHLNDGTDIKWEGVVVVDKFNNRIKVKNLDYVTASRIRSNISSNRNILTAILEEKWDDILPTLKGMDIVVEKGNQLQESLRTYIHEQDKLYHVLFDKFGQTRKDFAIACQDKANGRIHMPYMMSRYTGKIESFSAWIQSQRNKSNNEFGDGFLDSLLEILLPKTST